MTTPTVTFHLVRHGESHWNVEGRYQGHEDSGLTGIGVAQAEAAALWLQDSIPRIDLVASSDLPRVRDTAKPLVEAINADLVVDSRLREVDIGAWAGRLFDDVAGSEPEQVAAAARGEDVRRGGGETFAETRVRTAHALQDLADTVSMHSNDAVVVVFAHGGTIRVATAEALAIPTPGHARIGPPVNCSVTTLEYRERDFRLIRYNHLTAGSDIASPEPRRTEMAGLV